MAAIDSGKLRQGSCIEVYVPAQRGKSKPSRPAVVITPTNEIRGSRTVEVLAISTSFPEPPPANCFPLPWDPAGRCATGLRRRSAAVLDWLAVVSIADIHAIRGELQTAKLIMLLKRFADYHGGN